MPYATMPDAAVAPVTTVAPLVSAAPAAPAGVGQLLRAPANAALGAAGRRLLNTRLRGIGEITELTIDTSAQSLRARVSLAGELEPIEVYIDKYEVDRSGEDAALTVLVAAASRPWLDEALRRFAVGQRVTIPKRAGALLKLLS